MELQIGNDFHPPDGNLVPASPRLAPTLVAASFDANRARTGGDNKIGTALEAVGGRIGLEAQRRRVKHQTPGCLQV